MPRTTLDGQSFPLVIAAPGTLKRWFITGWLIQGAGDGLVKVSGGNGSGAANELMFSVRTAAGGGGAIAGAQETDKGTALDNAELILETTGTPTTVTGYIDYSWR